MHFVYVRLKQALFNKIIIGMAFRRSLPLRWQWLSLLFGHGRISLSEWCRWSREWPRKMKFFTSSSQPYIDLAYGNAPASRTILLDYSTRHAAIVSVSAYRHSHYLVALSSLIVLTGLAIQPLAAALFTMKQTWWSVPSPCGLLVSHSQIDVSSPMFPESIPQRHWCSRFTKPWLRSQLRKPHRVFCGKRTMVFPVLAHFSLFLLGCRFRPSQCSFQYHTSPFRPWRMGDCPSPSPQRSNREWNHVRNYHRR